VQEAANVVSGASKVVPGIGTQLPDQICRPPVQRFDLPKPLEAVQNYVDILIVTIFGALINFAVVVSVCAFAPVGHPIGVIQLLDTGLIAAVVGGYGWLLCCLFPVWLGLCTLVLQAISGVFVGQVIVNVICNSLGISPGTLGPMQGILSFLFTFLSTIVPAFALPVYRAFLESSSLRKTFGAMYSDYQVADLKGNRLSFHQAWKRALNSSLEAFLYPVSIATGKSYRDRKSWLEQSTATMLMKKQESLDEEVDKSKESVMVRYRAFQELEGVLGHDAQNVPKVMRKEDVSFRRASHAVWALSVVTAAIFIPVSFQTPAAIMRTFVLNGQGLSPLAGPAMHMPFELIEFGGQGFNYLVLALFVYFVLAACRPTHIQLSRGGLRIISKIMPGFMQDAICPWNKVQSVSLAQVKGKASVADHRLVFNLVDERKKISLRLGSISSIAGKDEILKAVERWAPTVPRSSDVITALQPPCDFSYTELWMEALTAPPKREKLKPLIVGASLREHQYKVLNMLGVGGQGTAYLAEDSLSSQNVVLKEFILPVYVEVGARRRALDTFEKEARLLKELSHPNVVKLFDYFIEDHRAYLVLEHIDGESLRALVNRVGMLPEKDVRNYAAQMCMILEYLHAQSPPVVHRDSTPDNLILRKDGTLKLIDFNVAQQSDSSAVSSVVGKPNYLSPEQFRGSPTTQSDIYALGACLQFLLTGEDPVAIISSDPTASRPDVSPQLSAIVQKATEPELANRFATASELLRQLEE
jgi:hypothetical protein